MNHYWSHITLDESSLISYNTGWIIIDLIEQWMNHHWSPITLDESSLISYNTGWIISDLIKHWMNHYFQQKRNSYKTFGEYRAQRIIITLINHKQFHRISCISKDCFVTTTKIIEKRVDLAILQESFDDLIIIWQKKRDCSNKSNMFVLSLPTSSIAHETFSPLWNPPTLIRRYICTAALLGHLDTVWRSRQCWP